MGRLLDEDIVIDALIGISGSKSIEELTEECEVYQSDNRCYSGGVYGAIRAIKTLPSVQPEPHEGEWEQVSAQRYFMSASYFYRCSACGVNNVRNTNFCPHCGAKMTISK